MKIEIENDVPLPGDKGEPAKIDWAQYTECEEAKNSVVKLKAPFSRAVWIDPDAPTPAEVYSADQIVKKGIKEAPAQPELDLGPPTPAPLHSELGASKADQWVTCTASVEFIRALVAAGDLPPEDAEEDKAEGFEDGTEFEDLSYANEGHIAHAFAKIYLQNHRDGIPVEDRLDNPHPALEIYLEECSGLIDAHRSDSIFIEERVKLWYKPEDYGTVDFAIVSEDYVAVRDLKWGAGILVEAVENRQIAIYALSLIRQMQNDGLYAFHPGTRVDMAIVQPRHRSREVIKEWAVSLAELEQFCEHIDYSAGILKTPSAPKVFAVTDKGCRFCRARFHCAEKQKSHEVLLGLSPLELKKMPLVRPKNGVLGPDAARLIRENKINDDLVINCVTNREKILALLETAMIHARTKLLAGQKLKGLKLVRGKNATREWKNIESATYFMREHGIAPMVERLKSPAVAEKELEKFIRSKTMTETEKREKFDTLQNLTHRPEPKVEVALEGDTRPELIVVDGKATESGDKKKKGSASGAERLPSSVPAPVVKPAHGILRSADPELAVEWDESVKPHAKSRNADIVGRISGILYIRHRGIKYMIPHQAGKLQELMDDYRDTRAALSKVYPHEKSVEKRQALAEEYQECGRHIDHLLEVKNELIRIEGPIFKDIYK